MVNVAEIIIGAHSMPRQKECWLIDLVFDPSRSDRGSVLNFSVCTDNWNPR